MKDEVGDWLESLLLAHDEADLLGLLVAEELAVASTTLLPLTISEAIELASDLEDALLLLLSGDLLDLGKLSLWSNELEIWNNLRKLGPSILNARELGLPVRPSSPRDQRSRHRESFPPIYHSFCRIYQYI